MSDIPRLSPIEREILTLLINRRGMYGLEMVKASSKLKRGTIYVTLGRMEDKGWVRSKAEESPSDPGMPRRIYEVTGAGQAVLRDREAIEAFMATRAAGSMA